MMIMILCEGVEIMLNFRNGNCISVNTSFMDLGLFNILDKYLHSTGTFGASGISSEER
jgi:hypothetical protein